MEPQKSKNLPEEISITSQANKPLPKTQLYYYNILQAQGQPLMKMQTTHMMVLYFFIGGLDILQKQEYLAKDILIEHIIGCQTKNGGFCSSTLYSSYKDKIIYDIPHIVFTFSAVNCLHILGGLNQVNKQALLESVKRCQKQDGSFSSFQNTSEADLRFVYSALSICKLLGDSSMINIEKAKAYIDSCFNYDGGFGLRPNSESHSGAIYCAIASYVQLDIEFPPKQKARIINFLVQRQATNQNEKVVGIQGRVGKIPDSCYSFWVGASLKLLTGQNLLNPYVQNFLWLCFKQKEQNFGKYPHSRGDPVHTFHSITGLKILRQQLGNLSLSQLIRMS